MRCLVVPGDCGSELGIFWTISRLLYFFVNAVDVVGH